MRKAREVMRLHHESKLGQREIARTLELSQGTVHNYLERAAAAGLSWPLPPEVSEGRLRTLLFPKVRAGRCPAPDWQRVRTELAAHKHLTLELLWQEYKAAEPGGYCYSRFCVMYRRWLGTQDPVMRQEHSPGERVWVDWAGATIPVWRNATEKLFDASIFVAVLGVSSYTYAEATADQQLAQWLGAHARAFAFFGGSPRLLVPDNLKTGVKKPCRYDPDVQPLYQEWCAYHQVGVLPARAHKPRDKAKAESGVAVVARWIVAALRHERFYSLADLNARVAALLTKLNHRPYKKLPGCRASVFAALDQPALHPLPEEAFPWSGWGKARVNIDYHIVFEHNYYSAPHNLLRREVELRWTDTTLEIFHDGERVASHARLRGKGHSSTMEVHRPPSHRAHREWPPERLVAWAAHNGPQTAALFEAILASKPHPEMGYRSCLGILRLAHKYSPERLERAAARALAHQACRYQSVKNILQRGLDREEIDAPAVAAPAEHDNLRGATYFSGEGEL